MTTPQTIFSFPLTALADGDNEIPSTPVPDGVSQIQLTMQRCTAATPSVWPNATTILEITLYGSIDNVNWQAVGGGTAAGGILTDPSGTEVTETFIAFSFLSSPKYVRASANVTNGPLSTSGTITAV